MRWGVKQGPGAVPARILGPLVLAACTVLPASAGAAATANSVETDLSARTGPDHGSAIALETDNPDRAIAAAATATGPPSVFVSDDGLAAGATRSLDLPAATLMPAGGSQALSLGGQPALAGDPEGGFWIASGTNAQPSHIYVNRVEPGGFSPASQGAALPRGSAGFQSQPAIAVNDWANGNPKEDTIYAAWIEGAGPSGRVVVSQCEPVLYASSCLDPGNWTAGNGLAAPAGSGRFMQPDLAIAPDGDVYVVWWDAGDDNAIEVNRCQANENCSLTASWDEPASVEALDLMDDDGDGTAEPLPVLCPIIAAPAGLVNPSPSIEIDPDGHVHVAYADLRDNADPARPSRCTGSGSDKTWDSFLAVGDLPGIVPGPGEGVRISSDAAGALNDHFLPALAIDRSVGRADVSYTTTDGDAGGQTTQRRYASSFDRGETFAEGGPLVGARSRFSGPNSDGFDYGSRQGLASAGGLMRAAWTDNRSLQNRDADLYALANQSGTTITSGPEGTVATAINSFTLNTRAPLVECSLDGGTYRICDASFATAPLTNGNHTLAARAADAVGNPVDLSPAQRSWSILDLTPPETRLTLAPREQTKKRRPFFAFESSEPGGSFECKYDQGPWVECPQGHKRRAVKLGPHRFRARAIDVGGNYDPTPLIYKFKRIKPKRKS